MLSSHPSSSATFVRSNLRHLEHRAQIKAARERHRLKHRALYSALIKSECNPIIALSAATTLKSVCEREGIFSRYNSLKLMIRFNDTCSLNIGGRFFSKLNYQSIKRRKNF